MLVRMWRKENLFALLVGMQTSGATLENTMEVPQTIKNRTNLQPAITLLGIYLKNHKNADIKGHMHHNVYSSTINYSQIME